MPAASKDKRLYKVVFLNQGHVYEVYAKRVSQGSLFGFVEIEGLVFGTKNQMVVDPSEERLQHEFQGVSRFHVPMHSVVRIDEVEKSGPSRISEAVKGTVTPFPMPIVKPHS